VLRIALARSLVLGSVVLWTDAASSAAATTPTELTALARAVNRAEAKYRVESVRVHSGGGSDRTRFTGRITFRYGARGLEAYWGRVELNRGGRRFRIVRTAGMHARRPDGARCWRRVRGSDGLPFALGDDYREVSFIPTATIRRRGGLIVVSEHDTAPQGPIWIITRIDPRTKLVVSDDVRRSGAGNYRQLRNYSWSNRGRPPRPEPPC